MRILKSVDLIRALDEAVVEQTCSDAWLGYAQVLFIGFGEVKHPTESDSEELPWVQYQIATNYADWHIEAPSGIIGDADDERGKAECAAESLIGRRAIGWEFIEANSTHGLMVEFAEGYRLVITPYASREASDQEGWRLRMPDGLYRIVKWDGTMLLVHGDEPYSDAGQ